MNVIELFVRRRVLAYMLSAAMLLFGFIGLRGVGLDRLPNVEPPLITVTTVNPGAKANPPTFDGRASQGRFLISDSDLGGATTPNPPGSGAGPAAVASAPASPPNRNSPAPRASRQRSFMLKTVQQRR